MVRSFSVLVILGYIVSLAGVRAQYELSIDRLEANLGFATTLPCRMKKGNKLCVWKHGAMTYYTIPYSFSAGYSVVGDPQKGNCDMKIDSVSMNDNGVWHCSIPGNTDDRSVNLVLLKKPTTFLKHNRKRILNNSTVFVESEIINVTCEANGSMPKSNITWEGKEITPSDYYEVSALVPKIKGTFDVRSELTLRIPQEYEEKFKEVTCVVAYSSQNKRAIRITALFSKKYETKIVSLKPAPMKEKNEVLLFCEADGMPVPKHHIVMISPRRENQNDHYGQTRTVTESGTYLCLAGNSELKSIKSNEVHVEIPYDDSKSNEDVNFEEEPMVIGFSVAPVILFIIIVVTVCCCIKSCRQKKKGNKTPEKKHARGKEENLEMMTAGSSTGEESPKSTGDQQHTNGTEKETKKEKKKNGKRKEENSPTVSSDSSTGEESPKPADGLQTLGKKKQSNQRRGKKKQGRKR